jgi:hypothetical protein
MVIEITAFRFLLLLITSYFNGFYPSFGFVIDLGLEICKLSFFFFLYCMFFFTFYSPFFYSIHYFILRFGSYAENKFYRVKKHLESLEAKKNTKISLTESYEQNIALRDE